MSIVTEFELTNTKTHLNLLALDTKQDQLADKLLQKLIPLSELMLNKLIEKSIYRSVTYAELWCFKVMPVMTVVKNKIVTKKCFPSLEAVLTKKYTLKLTAKAKSASVCNFQLVDKDTDEQQDLGDIDLDSDTIEVVSVLKTVADDLDRLVWEVESDY